MLMLHGISDTTAFLQKFDRISKCFYKQHHLLFCRDGQTSPRNVQGRTLSKQQNNVLGASHMKGLDLLASGPQFSHQALSVCRH